jgi:hypothetical protein
MAEHLGRKERKREGSKRYRKTERERERERAKRLEKIRGM